MRRILFTAPKSGSGKTMMTCSIIRAFMIKGYKVSAFKCGADYIDPMFHQNVLETKSGNIDTFFCDENLVNYLLKKESAGTNISVMEGVMGYYDGLGGVSTKGSTYDIARVTDTPTVLIIDCRGLSLTVTALIKGMIEYRNNSHIKGVILNRITGTMYPQIKKIIEEEVGVKVYGYLPQIATFSLKSRHLGLVMPNEIEDLQLEIDRLAIKTMETVDIDGLIDLASTAGDIEYEEPIIPKLDTKVRIGIAMDSAFCFYYYENLGLLEQMGAEIVTFSPLEDKGMPEGLDGVIFGGGYPELFAKELSTNYTMKSSIYDALSNGMPCLAECGGFLYLQQSLENVKGLAYPMVGFLSGDGIKANKLVRASYVNLKTEEETIFGEKGVEFRGHEYHFWDSTKSGNACKGKKPLDNKSWKCIVVKNNTFAGFPHIHYYSNVEAVFNFLKNCESRKED